MPIREIIRCWITFWLKLFRLTASLCIKYSHKTRQLVLFYSPPTAPGSRLIRQRARYDLRPREMIAGHRRCALTWKIGLGERGYDGSLRYDESTTTAAIDGTNDFKYSIHPNIVSYSYGGGLFCPQ